MKSVQSSGPKGAGRAMLLWLVVAASSPALATGSKITCSFKGTPDHVHPPVLSKLCTDFDTPMETCRSFELSGRKPFPWAYRSTAHKLPKDGPDLAFKPYGVRFGIEWIGGDGFYRWLVLFIDNSGSGSRAEERFLIVEDGTGTPLSKLMSYREYENFKKSRTEPGLEWEEKVLDMVCK